MSIKEEAIQLIDNMPDNDNHTGHIFLFGSIRDLGRIFEIPGNGVCITKDSTYRQEIPTLKSLESK